jgi:hypothetical protein
MDSSRTAKLKFSIPLSLSAWHIHLSTLYVLALQQEQQQQQ